MTKKRYQYKKRNEIVDHIQQNRALIYKVAYSYCTDIHEQEDLIQDIIFQIIRSYDKFDHHVKVTTWMYRVALNVSISHYRKVQTHKKHFAEMPEQLVEVEETRPDNVNEDVVQLRSFIQELNPLNRALLIMYLDSNSHAQIAEAMGITISNVGTKLGRIKKELKNRFKS